MEHAGAECGAETSSNEASGRSDQREAPGQRGGRIQNETGRAAGWNAGAAGGGSFDDRSDGFGMRARFEACRCTPGDLTCSSANRSPRIRELRVQGRRTRGLMGGCRLIMKDGDRLRHQLYRPVLVLNSSYEPINVCAARGGAILVLKRCRAGEGP